MRRVKFKRVASGRSPNCGATRGWRRGINSTTLLRACMTEFGMSARAHDKIIRVARTIADLEAARDIQVQHIGEAINYRLLDRQLWK